MTQEERQLLLIDLCGRLPYEVKFEFTRDNVRIAKGIDLRVTDEGKWEYFVTSKGASAVEITEIKPYLRPMESMTKKEIEELENISRTIAISGIGDWYRWSTINPVFADYLNSHYLDWRGLIPIGLALEAPEGIYKTE